MIQGETKEGEGEYVVGYEREGGPETKGRGENQGGPEMISFDGFYYDQVVCFMGLGLDEFGRKETRENV